MTEGSTRKLIVEVGNAKNLMPKDGQGTASAYVIVDFDGQRRRTKTKPRDLNPQWDEKLEFLVHDPVGMASETLEINVYNDKNKAGKRSTFLGKVKISGASFAASGSETLIFYPLEKRSVFSQIKGEIGLKVCYVDESMPPAEGAPPADQKAEADVAAAPAAGEGEKKAEEGKKTEEEEKPEEAAAAKTEEKPRDKEEEKKADDAGAAKPADDKQDKENLPIVAAAASTPSKEARIRSRFGDLEPRSTLCGERTGISYDLVERVPYLFVRVLKAKGAGDCERSLYAKVVIGSHIIKTKTAKQSTVWDQVFAFHKASLSSTALEVSVWEERS